jgi:hypothetical protein
VKYSNAPFAADYCRFGFSGAVPKPFIANNLAGKLERLLNRRDGKIINAG